MGIKNGIKNELTKEVHQESIGRTKQDTLQECILCNRTVKHIRSHLVQSHQLSLYDEKRQFILSFYRTKKVNIAVYQCNQCIIRFTNKRRDHKGHSIVELKNKASFSEFPPCIKDILATQFFATKD